MTAQAKITITPAVEDAEVVASRKGSDAGRAFDAQRPTPKANANGSTLKLG